MKTIDIIENVICYNPISVVYSDVQLKAASGVFMH